MDDGGEIELTNGFAELARYREQLKRATDPQVRAALYTRIRETEDRLARVRRELSRPAIRD